MIQVDSNILFAFQNKYEVVMAIGWCRIGYRVRSSSKQAELIEFISGRVLVDTYSIHTEIHLVYLVQESSDHLYAYRVCISIESSPRLSAFGSAGGAFW